MATKNYLEYILNPLDLLRTKKVLHVNPTVMPERKELTQSQIKVYEYNVNKADVFVMNQVEDCYPFLKTDSMTWINVDGLSKDAVEKLCLHFGIHPLIVEDILSVGQRPKMDEINGLVFCLLNRHDLSFARLKYSSYKSYPFSVKSISRADKCSPIDNNSSPSPQAGSRTVTSFLST